jgi:asparagine synthase (glutamine-hydrolysing)
MTSRQPNDAWMMRVRTVGPWQDARDGSAQSTSRCIPLHGTALYFAGTARLYNHSELTKKLGLPEATDTPELICHTYAAQGEGFERLLQGDFSFSLFDPGQQKILLVRDPLGSVPLYYHRSSTYCVASNSLDHLRALPGLTDRLSDGVVAEWCVNGHVYNQTETFFESIKKCPRATILRIEAHSERARQYWEPRDLAPLRYADERDYTAHLRQLIDSAITDRIDSSGPVAAHSSGGLDSSPIAILAARASRHRQKGFQTYNWCAPDAGDDADCHEWDDARQLARIAGFEHREIGITAAMLKPSLLHHDVASDGTTMFEYEGKVLKHAQQQGIRTIFSGFGGDELLTSRSRDKHYGLIRSGRVFEAVRRMALEASPERPWPLLRLAAAFGRAAYGSFRSAGTSNSETEILQARKRDARLELLKPDFAEFALTHYRELGYGSAETIAARQHIMLRSGYHQERMESWAILGLRAGVRHVYPYLDQRIVEFALTIPPDLYFRHGKPRHLYLQTVGDTLPDYLLRKSKQPEIYRVSQLMRERLRALSDPELLDRIAGTDSPYVDTKALLDKCREIRTREFGDLKAAIGPTQALTTAVLALNIGSASRPIPR